MDDRVHSGPGTCVAEVGAESPLTGALREVLHAARACGGVEALASDMRGAVAVDRLRALLPTTAAVALEPDGNLWRLTVTLGCADLDRLQRIHYRRRRPGARAPTSFAVYLPEGVVEFRPAEQDASTPPTPSCACTDATVCESHYPAWLEYQRTYRGIQFVPRTDTPEGHALLVGASNVCITNLKREQS